MRIRLELKTIGERFESSCTVEVFASIAQFTQWWCKKSIAGEVAWGLHAVLMLQECFAEYARDTAGGDLNLALQAGVYLVAIMITYRTGSRHPNPFIGPVQYVPQRLLKTFDAMRIAHDVRVKSNSHHQWMTHGFFQHDIERIHDHVSERWSLKLSTNDLRDVVEFLRVGYR